ncbi:MAG: glucose dehydrogenase [Isosphaeraceae bacterium]|nr:MAG: glucose dehydrogenase [Isosphaeraceae bacterium]
MPRFALLPLVLSLTTAAVAQEAATDLFHVEPASDEGQRAIAAFRVPPGMRVELFAAEPLLANPVAFALDPAGRAYVVETFRHSDGVTDTRSHMYWLDDDLASRSVADRVAMYRKHLSPEEFARYGRFQERLRLVVDTDGDGTADTATVFADGFGGPETGLAAGVLPVGDSVYFTCIPDLWKLRDTDGDGTADERIRLSTGYGVHVQFIGHDLHGLTLGPDGRLYFSIGDRGFNVTTIDGKRLAIPDSGSVLRCELDGSDLEVIHTGLRNPQELAFDEQGNLFTVDNNSDGGDRARLVWVVPGGESGWHIGWQYIEQPTLRGPWNAERMWQPRNDAQPAYLVPPLANFSDGPSGLAYNPGTALSPEQRGRFFLADFRGAATTSGVRSFAIRPKGAAFELADQNEFLWGLQATDVDFGSDGALYISDWVEGWNKTGKGRIYRVSDPDRTDRAKAAEVRRLLTEGMAGRPLPELVALLDHDDWRVRLEAQFELTRRAIASRRAVGDRPAGPDETLPIATLASAAAPDGPLRTRRHAIWGIAHYERLTADRGTLLVELLDDPDAEIRRQAARALGDLASAGNGVQSAPGTFDALVARLSDDDPQVRFHAAIALGNLRDPNALTPLLEMLRANDDADAYLRHAGVMGLAGVADDAVLVKASDAETPAVRLAILLALRRHGSPEVARFLADPEPRIVLEAARAIHDATIPGDAEARLAALTLPEKAPSALVRRVLAANERIGGSAGADALAALAERPDLDPGLRAEALDALGTWANPSGRDRVTGLWRPIGERDPSPAVAALRRVAPALLADSPGRVMTAAARAAGRLGLAEAIPALEAIVTAEKGKTGEARLAALEALEALQAPGLVSLVAQAVEGKDPNVRAAALKMLGRLEPARALPILARVVENGTTRERQQAFTALGDIDAPEADALLAAWLDRLAAGDAPAEVALELVEAARKRSSPEVKDRLARRDAAMPADDPLAPYQVALAGGDARSGARVFRENAAVYCLRCHKVRGEGGEVGPELTGIGQKKDRTYLLEAIVTPNKTIAEGFETRVLALDDGTIVAGVVKAEDDTTLTLATPEATLVTVDKARIEEQRGGDSAMPADLVTKMSLRELRDLIEYLATVGEGRDAPAAEGFR